MSEKLSREEMPDMLMPQDAGNREAIIRQLKTPVEQLGQPKKINVFKVESPMITDFRALYLKTIHEMHDFEATIGMFLCLPGEEQDLEPGHQVIISVIEMSEEEYDALPGWEP